MMTCGDNHNHAHALFPSGDLHQGGEAEAAGLMTQLPELLRRIVTLPPRGRRRLVAISGVPASGKSTLAAALTSALNASGQVAENVGMDGFHLDNRLLDAMGLRDRKGAPETFDAQGFVSLVRRLRSEEEIYYPVFDRGRDHAIAGGGVVSSACDLVLVEGNYLLFDADPWRALKDFWDLTVWIETSEEVVRARCIQRWLDYGHQDDTARRRAEDNDLKNARRITESRLPADVVVVDR
jgi:pantothenate kinase